MDKYYVVFDNTAYTADSLPQIGLGLKDENIILFKNQYDNSDANQ